MKIIFIRHGETVDNIKRVYAGVTDSQLTSHGVLQAEYLAKHVKQHLPEVTHAFASPLSRAKQTCQAVLDAQASEGKKVQIVVSKDLEEQDFGSYEGEPFLSTVPLRERRKFKGDGKKPGEGGGGGSVSISTQLAGSKRKKDREEEAQDDSVMTAGEQGPLTGKADLPNAPVGETETEKAAEGKETDPKKLEEEELEEFREMESIQHITERAERFVRDHLVPLLPATVQQKGGAPPLPPPAPSANDKDQKMEDASPTSPVAAKKPNPMVVIVSHGIFLSHLWKAFISLFPPNAVLATTPVVEKGWYQGKNPGWGNTGYMHVSVFAGSGGPVVSGNMTVVIEGVNEKEHLKNLRKTGGGVGNEKFDEKQKKMDSFLKSKEDEDAPILPGDMEKAGAEVKKTRTE